MFIKKINTNIKSEVKTFLNAPQKIYQGYPQWVPPLARDARRMLDRKRHPFCQSGEAEFFVLFTDSEEPIGRIAVLDNRRYNQHNGTNTVFFYLFDVIDDVNAAKMIFNAAFEWGKNRRRTQILGPKGFSALDGLGMLAKGFEHRAAFGIHYNYAYYPEFMDMMGFSTIWEILPGYMSGDQQIPEKVHKVSEWVQERRGLRVDWYASRRDLRKLLPYLKELYNGSLMNTSGNAVHRWKILAIWMAAYPAGIAAVGLD